MKKSLIALAALAAVTAASAQSTVTLSGKLAFGYQSAQSATAGTLGTVNGLGVTDGDFVLTAVEDLGGGLKATMVMSTLSRGRDTTISGRDSSITLGGGFGSVMVGAIEAANGILGLAAAGAPVIGLDSRGAAQSDTSTGSTLSGISRAAVSTAANTDILMYTTPSISGFSFSAAIMDAPAAFGAQNTAASHDSMMLRASYAAGPLAAMVDMTQFDKNAMTAVSASTPDDRLRLSASYDLGVMKIGGGYEKLTSTAATNNVNKQTVIGASVPLGAFTLGAVFSNNKLQGGTSIKGTEVGVNYALSKRTGVRLATQTIKETGLAGSADRTQLRLMHTF